MEFKFKDAAEKRKRTEKFKKKMKHETKNEIETPINCNLSTNWRASHYSYPPTYN